jgi:hypothetical protein
MGKFSTLPPNFHINHKSLKSMKGFTKKENLQGESLAMIYLSKSKQRKIEREKGAPPFYFLFLPHMCKRLKIAVLMPGIFTPSRRRWGIHHLVTFSPKARALG